MNRAIVILAVAGVLAGLASSASATYLMVTNFSSSNRSIMLFNKSDGSLVSQNWIVGDGGANIFNSQTEALSIGSDVWISDQVQNKVFRYNLSTGTYKAAITGSGSINLSNIRGMERVGNTVYVANAGSGFGNSIVRFDANTGAFLGSTAISQFVPGTDHSPWDIKYVNNELLVSVYAASGTNGTSRIDRYDLSGNYLGNLYNQPNTITTGIRGPQQINTDGSNLLIASFSGTTQTGIYQTTSAISTLNFYAGGLGPRAGYRLDNGKIMITKGDGVFILDPTTNTLSSIAGIVGSVNAKYISEIEFIPTPGTLALLGFGGLVAARRRR